MQNLTWSDTKPTFEEEPETGADARSLTNIWKFKSVKTALVLEVSLVNINNKENVHSISRPTCTIYRPCVKAEVQYLK
jgi:hypothetical protein